MSNLNDRLERLHSGDCLANNWGVQFNYIHETRRTQDETEAALPSGSKDSTPDHGSNAAIPGSPSIGGPERHGPSGSDDRCSRIAGGAIAAWSGGSVDFGTMNLGQADHDLGFTSVNVSAGLDYRLNERFAAGFGVGFGRDQSRIGKNGKQTDGRAYSATLYGSYHPTPQVFLDALVGFGVVRFDSQRYLTDTGGFAPGLRNGNQVFGALTFGYDYENSGFLFSPYGRLTASRTTLDEYTETGGSWTDLRYGQQYADTFTAFLGMRLGYEIKTDWGSLTPRARLEYGHDFAGNSTTSLSFADLSGRPSYRMQTSGTGQNHATIGLGADVDFGSNLTFGAEYEADLGQQGLQAQQLRFILSTQF